MPQTHGDRNGDIWGFHPWLCCVARGEVLPAVPVPGPGARGQPPYCNAQIVPDQVNPWISSFSVVYPWEDEGDVVKELVGAGDGSVRGGGRLQPEPAPGAALGQVREEPRLQKMVRWDTGLSLFLRTVLKSEMLRMDWSGSYHEMSERKKGNKIQKI